MKENYQKQLDALLAALPPEGKPRLLLQSCCGPCSSYVLEYLTRYFRVTVLYYNPNIQPRDEYDRRLYWQRELIRQLPTPEPVDLLACDYDGQRYIDAVRGLEREPEGGARCRVCFALRLHPQTRVSRMRKKDFEALITEMRRILGGAVRAGGTTIRSYTSSLGVDGRFQLQLRVHAKKGERCPLCGEPIKKITVGGRGTYYCERCQKRR